MLQEVRLRVQMRRGGRATRRCQPARERERLRAGAVTMAADVMVVQPLLLPRLLLAPLVRVLRVPPEGVAVAMEGLRLGWIV